MGNEEYKEIMRELYKFLRDKISIAFGEKLSDEAKEKLFSFDFENNIVVDAHSHKIIEYKFSDDKFYVCDEFLTPEYVEKTKEKNPEFDLVDLKNRVNSENPRVILEELVAFSGELKITEKDLIKSLFVQEILKMLLLKEDMEAKEDAIMTGAIELLAHKLGSQNGFLVSTPKKYSAELDVAIGLKEELEDKFEEIILKGSILDYLSRIENGRLLQKIDELADNRKIIESTQNLDNVIESIVNMTNENQQIIDSSVEENENEEMPQEEVIEIPASNEKTVLQEEVSQPTASEVIEKNVEPSMPEENVQTYTGANETSIASTDKKVGFIQKHKRLLIYSGIILLTIALGIVLGYLLFIYK